MFARVNQMLIYLEIIIRMQHAKHINRSGDRRAANQLAKCVHTYFIWDVRWERRKANLISFIFASLASFLFALLWFISQTCFFFCHSLSSFYVYSESVVTQKLIKMHHSQSGRVLTKWYCKYWNQFCEEKTKKNLKETKRNDNGRTQTS